MYKLVATFSNKEPEISYYATADEALRASTEAKENGAFSVKVTPK